MQFRRIAAWSVGFALLLGFAMWLWSKRAAPSADSRHDKGGTSETRAGLAQDSGQAAPGESAGPIADVEREGLAPRPIGRLDENARHALQVALRKARSQAISGEPKEKVLARRAIAALPLDIENKSGSTSEWEERQLQTLRELLGECYQLALDEEPGLVGTFGLTFSLSAEPEIGGLVESLSVMEEYSSIDNATMRECMLESIYALELDPPTEGVQFDRSITLRFDGE